MDTKEAAPEYRAAAAHLSLGSAIELRLLRCVVSKFLRCWGTFGVWTRSSGPHGEGFSLILPTSSNRRGPTPLSGGRPTMHYIRILKAPRLHATSPLSLTAKIAITTDLGESFLLSNISLIVELESEDGTSVLGTGKGREYVWRGRDGMRGLEIVIPLPAAKGKRKIVREMVRMLVRPKEEQHAVKSFGKVLEGQHEEKEGGVVAVRSMAVDISPGAKSEKAAGVGMAERVFSTGIEENEKRVRIWEETGESIARHIWYAAWIRTGTSYLSYSTNNLFIGMPGWCFPHTFLPSRQSHRHREANTRIHDRQDLKMYCRRSTSMFLSSEQVVGS